MFSLQQLLGKEDKFFDLLEASAEEGRASVQALIFLIENPTKVKNLEDFVASRRKEKQIASQISDALTTTFITAFEREDIEALSQVLYRIPKTVEKIGERILLAPHMVVGVDFSRHTAMMDGASKELLTMLKELRKKANLERMHALNATLQNIEGEADKLMLELLRDLYSGKHEPLKAVFLKDLYELLEKVIDRYRDAGNVVNHIVLKNS
jgi:uncharacterized protein Yka (UPF0111/DUF47 family)